MIRDKEQIQQAIEKLLKGFLTKSKEKKKEYREFINGHKVDMIFGVFNRVAVIKIDGMNDTHLKGVELLKFLEENKQVIEERTR